ncbi:MAG: exopolysaccharide biosynthesis polyprenyl glycosylphosphotransferase, partial [Clostridia bacterium]|nr:exopolysaccharide biosynthesis polyprenyl glycosylphosphotransferase [Clostridia bacterium]
GMLMVAFEKYRPGIMGLWERNVINVLSVIVSFVVFALLNLIFFTSRQLLMLQLAMAAAGLVLLIVSNAVINAYFGNEKIFRKSRLLIIDTENRNFSRMKRIKYGVAEIYDSWYECINKEDSENVEEFAERMFPQFDSICVLDGLSDNDYNVAVSKAMELNKEIFVVPKIIDVGKCRAHLVRFDDILTLYMPEHSLNMFESAVKRFCDIVLSGIGLVVAAIPMAIIAAAIKLTSPGPVFYKQVRLTKGKKEFEILKFRTMIADAEKLSGPTFAQKDDPRITKVGKILRACRLDELPQLLNIFRGDMSVVGPRPERPFFVEQFENEIEHYDYRFGVKAGLTALSHVYGRYSTYIHDRTCYDLFYIANYSLLLDIKIILLTAKTMFLKSAAEGEDEFKIKTKEVVANEKE